jgi:glycosyltransferase involved in cell wall biosynthesis
MPSRYEGFGMVLIEAMNNGCPAIAFDCKCGPSDIIEDGKNGYLCKAEDIENMKEKILNLIENPDILKKMSEYAPGSVAKFSASEFVRRWENLLNET